MWQNRFGRAAWKMTMRCAIATVRASSVDMKITLPPASAKAAKLTVDLGFRADVDAVRRSSIAMIRAPEASQRAISTFCWLPPESEPTGASIDAQRIPSDPR